MGRREGERERERGGGGGGVTCNRHNQHYMSVIHTRGSHL